MFPYSKKIKDGDAIGPTVEPIVRMSTQCGFDIISRTIVSAAMVVARADDPGFH